MHARNVRAEPGPGATVKQRAKAERRAEANRAA